MIADHSGYKGATSNAIAALSPAYHLSSAIYVKGADVDTYINSIKAMRPRVLAVHFSIFESVAKARPRGLRQLVAVLETGKNAVHPYYIVYSGAFRHVPTRADSWVRRPGHPFDGVPLERIATISLSGLKRFVSGNGENALIQNITVFERRGACVP